MDIRKIPIVSKLLSKFTALKMSYLKERKSRSLMMLINMKMESNLSPINDRKLM